MVNFQKVIKAVIVILLLLIPSVSYSRNNKFIGSYKATDKVAKEIAIKIAENYEVTRIRNVRIGKNKILGVEVFIKTNAGRTYYSIYKLRSKDEYYSYLNALKKWEDMSKGKIGRNYVVREDILLKYSTHITEKVKEDIINKFVSFFNARQ